MGGVSDVKDVKDFPRLPLASLPTPFESLPRLGDSLGLNLWIKRDDYTGLGGGGNKVRKLEFLMAEAVEKRANVVITTGGHQSNHARLVAAAACRLGMKPVLLLRGDRPNIWQGNLLLDRLFGAEFEFLSYDDYLQIIDERMAAQVQRIKAQGLNPHVIPLGGASSLGALGYVLAVQEMAEQWAQLDLPHPDYLVVAAGSAGTQAGLEVGFRRWWPRTKTIGISVSWPTARVRERVAQLAMETAQLLGWPYEFTPEDVWVEGDFIGPRYGVPSEGAIRAIHHVALSEGIVLDPVYTGKAMDGLMTLAKGGTFKPQQRVIFLHTGGMPSLFSFANAFIE
jgi:D-cysteine desulfhydrase family pyridoxal phosphate-dependent enzyme